MTDVPRLRRIWYGMKQRCENPNSTNWSTHGARGITLCSEWQSYQAFANWSYMNGYEDNDPTLTIDRIDNDGNYEPGNCRWTDYVTQANNRRSNRRVTAFDQTMTLTQWSRDPRCLVGITVVRRRLDKGWDPEDAMIVPGREVVWGDIALGTRFGRLVVTGPSVDGDGKGRLIPVHCDCGTSTFVFTSRLRGCRHLSCGCQGISERELPIGTTVGLLTVIGPSVFVREKRRATEVRCACGQELRVDRWKLASDRVHSCGCLARTAARTKRAPEIGVRFGALEVIGSTFSTGRRLVTPVRCACGTELEVGTKHLAEGRVDSCRASHVMAFGEVKTIRGWADDPRCVVPETLLRVRLRADWDVEQAITTAARPMKPPVHGMTVFGETKSVAAWARDPRAAVSPRALYRRLQLGWDPYEALITPVGGRSRKAAAA